MYIHWHTRKIFSVGPKASLGCHLKSLYSLESTGALIFFFFLMGSIWWSPSAFFLAEGRELHDKRFTILTLQTRLHLLAGHSRSWEIINYKYLLKVASLGAYALEARICVRRASNIFGRLFFYEIWITSLLRRRRKRNLQDFNSRDFKTSRKLFFTYFVHGCFFFMKITKFQLLEIWQNKIK